MVFPPVVIVPLEVHGPCHRLVMPASRQPANVPTQRCGAVGSPDVYDGEKVTGE